MHCGDFDETSVLTALFLKQQVTIRRSNFEPYDRREYLVNWHKASIARSGVRTEAGNAGLQMKERSDDKVAKPPINLSERAIFP